MTNLSRSRIASLMVATLFALGCEGAPLSPGGGSPDERVPIDGDAGLAPRCVRPQQGCLCQGEPPIACFLDPVENPDGSFTCREGTRYCRDGLWTGCEAIHEYTLENRGAALVTGPTECNPCDPSCAIHIDTPDSADLPGSSSSVAYDTGSGGVILDPGLAPPPPPLPDSDGDGIPDVVDGCPGPGAFQNADGSCYGDTFFYHSLPYNGSAVIDPFDIDVQVRSADVYFLMDTTGSMGGEIANLQSTLTSGSFITGCSGGVIGAIRCTIPDAYFGVGRYDDFPYASYGGSSDVVFEHLQDIDVSVTASQAAVNTMYASGGWDWPESQSQALYAVATGNGLGGYLPARSGCPADTYGYPCFRQGSIPIVIHVTDAPFHNGPSGYYPYSASGLVGEVSWADAVSALNARQIRVITIVSSGLADAINDANALADATGSYDSSGARYVYNVSSSGTGLDASIVNAVVDLANYSRIDISARAVDNPMTALDERGFVDAIAANAWGPGSCSGISGGDTFIQCLPGTEVDFSVSFRNDVVMATATPQTFSFDIEILGDGAFVLETIPVRILVPPPEPLYPPTGAYWRDYDSTLYCADNERPDWGDLSYELAALPAGTSAKVELRAAETLAALPGAPPIVHNVASLTGTLDVGDLLFSAGLPAGLPYVRVTVVLNANPLLTETPVLESFTLLYSCVPTE